MKLLINNSSLICVFNLTTISEFSISSLVVVEHLTNFDGVLLLNTIDQKLEQVYHPR